MMNDQPSTATPLTLSTVTIETADSQGHSVPLAAPIQVSGQFDASAFFDQYPPNQQLVATPTALEIGVDEAGRGPLLGSVTVAAAILPKAWSGLIEERLLRDTPLSILTDSKQLSEKKRDRLYPLVQTHALGYVIADVPAAIIDQINILQATQLGMRLCAEALIKAVAAHCASAEALLPDSVKRPQFTVLFDGNRCPEIHFSQLASFGVMQADVECQAWIKGDARHTSIAAASVLAKVSRDQTMYALAEQYPNYGIAKHKGYPTRAHLAAIAAHGVLPEHRRSFAPIKEALKS